MDTDQPGASDPSGPTVEAPATPVAQTDGGNNTANADPTTPQNKAPEDAAEAPPQAERIQIILKDQAGTQIAFAVKTTTRMERVMHAYASKNGRPLGSLRFYFDGRRVLPEDTSASVRTHRAV